VTKMTAARETPRREVLKQLAGLVTS
jgi:hypothetical protein